MKKLLSIALFAALLTSCHYGTEEAEKTLKTNEEYKTDKADYSVNRANVEAAKPETTEQNNPTDSAKAE